MLSQLWKWLDGKKTVVSVVLWGLNQILAGQGAYDPGIAHTVEIILDVMIGISARDAMRKIIDEQQ